MSVEDEILLPHDVAEMLGVTTRTVARWANAGLIPYSTTLGGHRRFRREDVETMADRLAQKRAGAS